MEVYAWYRAAGDDSGVLIELLNDPRPLRRLAAARMFGRHGSLEHIVKLEDAMSSSSPELKVALEEAVTCIRARTTSGQEKAGPLSEDQLEVRLSGLGNVLWVEKVDNHLISPDVILVLEKDTGCKPLSFPCLVYIPALFFPNIELVPRLLDVHTQRFKEIKYMSDWKWMEGFRIRLFVVVRTRFFFVAEI